MAIFRKTFFKVVEVRDNGVTVTHYYHKPSQKQIKEIVNDVKNSGRRWEKFKDGMVMM